MPAQLADSPLTCVAVGAGQSLEEFPVLSGNRGRRSASRRRAARRGRPGVLSPFS
jgi:rod shape-determining protein MreB